MDDTQFLITIRLSQTYAIRNSPVTSHQLPDYELSLALKA
jgi:hypothetical protein